MDLLRDKVIAAMAGRREHVDALLRAIMPMVRRMVRAFAAPAGSEDELVQKSLIQVVNGLSSLRDPSRFEAWLARIVRRRVMDRLRKEYREIFTREAEGLTGDEMPTVDEKEAFLRLHYEELVERVEKAIAKLPVAYREVLTLRLIGDLGIAEISARTGLNENTVKTRVARGRRRLKRRLEGRI